MAQEPFILEIARYLRAKYQIDGITARVLAANNFWLHYNTEYPKGKFPERYDVLIDIPHERQASPPHYTTKDIAFFKAAATKANFCYDHVVEHMGRVIFREKESPLEIFAEELIGQWEERSEKFDVLTKIPNCDLSPVELIEATKLFLRALKTVWEDTNSCALEVAEVMILELSEKWDNDLAKADKELEKLVKDIEIGYFLGAR